MRLTGLFIVILLLVPVSIICQEKLEEQSVFDSYLNPERGPGIFRIPGLEFHSSVGFSYSSSNSFGSFGMGYYLGHFDLQLGKSLTLHWDVGVRSLMTESDAYGCPGLFVPNVDLTYKPNDTFLLKFSYGENRYPPYLMRRRF